MATATNRMLGHLGDSVERLEDPPLVTGKGRFVGDINFPDQLHMRIVRSAHAHGTIKSIDTSAAEAFQVSSLSGQTRTSMMCRRLTSARVVIPL